MSDQDLEISFEVNRAIHRFQEINEAEGLSQEDKERLKGAYLQNYFTPTAQELLRSKLAAQKAREERRYNWHRSPLIRPKNPTKPAS